MFDLNKNRNKKWYDHRKSCICRQFQTPCLLLQYFSERRRTISSSRAFIGSGPSRKSRPILVSRGRISSEGKKNLLRRKSPTRKQLKQWKPRHRQLYGSYNHPAPCSLLSSLRFIIFIFQIHPSGNWGDHVLRKHFPVLSYSLSLRPFQYAFSILTPARWA